MIRLGGVGGLSLVVLLEPLEGLVRHPDKGIVSITVLEVTGTRLIAIVAASVLPEQLRCAFVQRGQVGASLELLAKVVEARAQAGQSGAELDAIALYSSAGREYIEAFLTGVLGFTDYHDGHFVTKGRGLYFLFDTNRLEPLKKAPPQAAVKQALRERRWQYRVELGMPITADRGVGAFRATLLDVSRHGARVASACDLPEVGRSVTLKLRVQAGRIVVPVAAEGTVRWSRRQTGRQSYLAGVKLERIQDGAHGKRWDSWVEELSQSRPVQPAFTRGTELPASAVRAASDTQ